MKKYSSHTTLLLLGIILTLGFYLRIKSVGETEVIAPLSKDAKLYYTYAYNLRYKHTYSMQTGKSADLDSAVKPDSLCSPGYPLFLTLFIDSRSDKNALNRIYLSQAILSTLTLLFAFLFYKSFMPQYWSAATSVLLALSPHLIVANSYILTETLFCFFLVLAGWGTGKFIQNPSFKIAAILGIILGTTNLIRPSLQYFPVVLSFFLLINFGAKKGSHLFWGILLGFTLISAPWFIRNVISVKGESNRKLMINFLHHGMYPDFMYDGKSGTYGFPYRYDPRADEINKDIPSVLNEISTRFLRNPSKYLLWYLVKKPIIFWSWNLIQGRDVFVYPVSASPYFYNKFFQWTHFLMYTFHGGIVFFCLFGSVMSWFPFLQNYLPHSSILIARFASLLIIYFILIHIIGAPFPRYSIPLRPYLYGLAAFFLHILILVFKKFRKDH